MTTNSRVTGSWTIRWRNHCGPDHYVRHVSGRDVWLDAPENAAVFPTRVAAIRAMQDVRDRSSYYVMRSIGHEAQKQAEAQGPEETEAERAYRRTWGPRTNAR